MNEDILDLDTITVNTGEQSEIYPKIEEYFDRVQREIDSKLDKLALKYPNSNQRLNPHFERGAKTLVPVEWVREGLQGRSSDERLHFLHYRHMVAAVVYERRTQFNMVNLTFFNRLDKILKKDSDTSS